ATGFELGQSGIIARHQRVERAGRGKPLQPHVIHSDESVAGEELRRPRNGGCGKYCLGRRGRYQQRQPVSVRDFLKTKCLVRRRAGDCEAAPLLSAEIADIDSARTHDGSRPQRIFAWRIEMTDSRENFLSGDEGFTRVFRLIGQPIPEGQYGIPKEAVTTAVVTINYRLHQTEVVISDPNHFGRGPTGSIRERCKSYEVRQQNRYLSLFTLGLVRKAAARQRQ